MKEEEDKSRDDDAIGAVDRFKRSLMSGRSRYFDVSEFEEIVEQLLEEGDLQASEIAAKQGIQIHPNAVPLQLKYAQILLNKGMYKKSLKYIQLAEKIDENNPDVHLLKGSARMIMGFEDEALLSFRKAIRNAGADLDDILYHIGSAYVQVGEIPKAIYYLEKAAKVNPKNDQVLYDLGFFHDQQGNSRLSIKYYDKYLDIDPFNQYVWFNIGTVYNKIEKYNKAISAYEFAYAIDHKFHMAIFNMGNAHANAGHFGKAIEKYNEFIENEPDNDDAYCYIGECYLNLEEHQLSEANYRTAVKINPKNDTGWFGIGLIKWIQQDYEASIEYIQKAIGIDDINPEYWLTLGKVHHDFDSKTSAVKALKKAAQLEPENTEIWLTWTEVYVTFKETENAIRILLKATSNNKDVILKYRLVALLLQIRKSKQAFEILDVAMNQDFDEIEFLYTVYPNALKNKRLKKIVEQFKSTKSLD